MVCGLVVVHMQEHGSETEKIQFARLCVAARCQHPYFRGARCERSKWTKAENSV